MSAALFMVVYRQQQGAAEVVVRLPFYYVRFRLPFFYFMLTLYVVFEILLDLLIFSFLFILLRTAAAVSW